MKLIISESTTIQDIRTKFVHHYPFLTIEFFNPEKEKTIRFTEQNKIHEKNQPIRNINSVQLPCSINISSHIKVVELEKAVEDTTGLAVQIYRKSGKVWLQTTATDHWTLDMQNRKGIEMNVENEAPAKLDPDFYHEQE